ncbi:MAG: hypothetical protein QG608_923 [Actinomycetota bacterium]|nr:hypothetical protein [Actinomycetota bacterium]
MKVQRTLDVLASSARVEFLTLWIQALCVAARDPDAAADGQADKRWAGINEVILTLATQITSYLRGGPPAYPEVALLATLKEKATIGTCVGEVRWAANEALRRLDLRSGDRWSQDVRATDTPPKDY